MVLGGVICGGNVTAPMRDGKRTFAAPVPRAIDASQACEQQIQFWKESGGATTLNAAPPWITPGKMGVQGCSTLAAAMWTLP